MKLLCKRHFVENKTHYAACPKNAVYVLVAYTGLHKMNVHGVFRTCLRVRRRTS
jgi:hypothetical protein